ncbi:N6-Methyl-AMP deaminase-like [Littorina saxatilis]|uniref:Adenosine deaminase domain-containing protein n=1 Tax=Littorina saxatilis TaxID=31220 RepID=A0AAN9C443_9CAEN
MGDGSVDQFCHAMPKIELHAHLNTCFDSHTLKELVERKSQTNKDVSINWSMSISDCKEMDDSFNVFKLIHQVVDDEEAVYKLTVGVIRSFAADNVKYLELRSTPKEIPRTGMTRELYVRTMLRGVRDCQAENLDIEVYLLLSIDRRNSVEVAQLTVDLAEKFKEETDGLVVGIDFSGDPAVGNAADFIPVFLSAKQKGLKVASHLAELPKFEETLAVLRQAPPDRIGHGTFLHRYEPGQGHEEIEDIVLTKKIPIEACMTSNLKTKTVTVYMEHHFNFWFQKKHPVVICTDGTGVYQTTVSEEYAHAARTFNFSRKDLWHLSLASIDCIFAPESVKNKLREKWQAAFPHDP